MLGTYYLQKKTKYGQLTKVKTNSCSQEGQDTLQIKNTVQ